MTRASQVVLACVGFAAVLIIFVHPLFWPPLSTPVKAPLVSMFLTVVTAWLTFSLQRAQFVHGPAEFEDVFTPPEDERLSLICTLIC